MTRRTAVDLVRSLARGDLEQDLLPARVNARKEIRGWRRTSSEGGDAAILQAIETLGIRNAARVYAAEVMIVRLGMEWDG